MLINNINMKEQIKRIPLSDFQLDKKPTMDDYDYISNWMKEAFENELDGYSLYRNINGFIYDAFVENSVFVLRYKGDAIAFLTFSPPAEDSIIIIFRIVCVHPNFLRMGLATYLHKMAIEHFKKQGCLVAELWDVSPKTHRMGKSMGFIEKKKMNKDGIDEMFKILIETRKQNRRANIRFAVWDNCCYDTSAEPIFSWSLNFQRDKKPIVHYCYGDWTVGIIKDGLSLGGGRAKHFCDILREGNIIYINEKKAKDILEILSQYLNIKS